VARGSKSRLVKDSQISQNLAIDLDLRLFQAIHEGAVFHAEFPGRGIDAGNPQAAELTFPLPAVAIGILTCLHHRLFGDAVDILATTAVTLGQGKNLLVARVRRYTTFDSRHRLSP
jgi:hypothetical protein